jgi:glycosyl transferase family 1
MTRAPDVLVVSLGTTLGWRLADRLLAEELRDAGASVEAVSVGIGWTGRLRRGYPVNDLVEAVAARRTIATALERVRPRAAILCTTTTAMLAPRIAVPYAVRLDAPARMNRPGARNAVLWPLERRALARARLVLPFSRAAVPALPPGAAPAVVVRPPLTPAAGSGEREPIALAYVPDPGPKGLDVVAEAWRLAGVEPARLEVYGVDRERGLAHLREAGVAEPPRVDWRGVVAPDEFRRALGRAWVYAGGARWEDFGQAPLEALAAGALLATVPSGGPFEAGLHARELDPALAPEAVAPEPLAGALRAAFAYDDERARRYRERAAELLAPFAPGEVRRTVEREVLPRLLG